MAGSSIVGILKVLLTADIAEYESAMKRGQQLAKQWSSDLSTMGRQATTLGSALTRTLTLPLIGIGTAAAKAAMDFESSFAGVRKTVNATDAEFAAMAQSFRDLAKTIPINVNELNRLGEAAGALGIPKQDIVEFARVMALVGVTTNLSSDQAAEGIAKIQNIFGAAGKDTERFASTLVALGNNGASTESQILEMATRIAGAGNAVGMTQGQVLAFASALSSVGIEAEMGGSAISRVFINISKAVNEGGQNLTDFARVAGVPVQEFARLFKEDAASAVNAFILGLGKVKASGGDLIGTIENLGFSEIRVRDTLMRVAGAGDLVSDALALQATAWSTNSALQNEANQRFKTTASQLTLLWNRITDVGITLGNALLPLIKAAIQAFDAFIPVLDRMAKGFANLPLPVQASLVGLVGLAAAAGPVIWVFGQLLTAASTVAGAFTATGLGTRALTSILGVLRPALTAVVGAGEALVAALLTITAPIALIIGAVGALAAAWAYMTGDWTRAFDVLFPPLGILRAGWDTLRDAMAPHKQLLSDIATIISSSLTVAWFVLKSALTDFVGAVLGPLAAGWRNVKEAVGAVVDWVQNKAIWAFEEFKKAVADIPGFKLLLAIFERMKATGESAKQVIHDMAGAFKDTADAVTGTLPPIHGVSGAFDDLANRKLQPLTTGLELFNHQAEVSGKEFADMMARAAGFSGKLAELKEKVAHLTAAQRAEIDAGREMGRSNKEIAEAMSLSEETVAYYKKGVEDLNKAETKRTKEQLENLKNLGALEGKIRDENEKFRAEAVRGYEEQTAAMRKYWQDYDAARGEQSLKDARYWQDWAANSTSAIHHQFVALKAAVKENSPDPQFWEQSFEGLKTGLQNVLVGVPQILVQAFTGGGDISGAIKSLATQVGSEFGKAIGFALSGGSEFGKAIGGAIGSMAGLLVDGFKKIFGITAKEEIKKANVEISKLKENLIKTYGSLDDLERKANLVGISFRQIWSDQGKQGLKEFNTYIEIFERRLEAIGQATKKVVDGFAAVATGLTAPWRDLGDRIEKARQDAADAKADLDKLAADEKTSADQLAAAREKSNEATARLTVLLGQQRTEAERNKTALADLGTQAIATFAAALIQTGSYDEAMKLVGPTLRMLADTYKALGLDVEDVGLKHLLMQSTVAEGNPLLISAVSGLGTSMQGLAQMGLLNVDTFAAMQRTGLEMYTRLQGEVAKVGGNSRDALLPMQGYLQQAAAQAELLGIPLDDNTLLLIAQSKELGIWREKGKSAQDLLIDGMKELVDKVSELLTNMLGVTGAINGLPARKDVEINIYTHEYVDRQVTETVHRPAATSDGFATGTLGRLGKWFGSFPKAGFSTLLHGVEAVITPDQALPFALDTIAGLGGMAPAMAGAGMSGVEQRLDAMNDRLDRHMRSMPTLVALAAKNQPGRRRG